MRSLLFLFLLLASLAGAAQGVRVTEASIVRDSAGTVYPAAVWQSLLMKGTHTLRAENPKDPSTAFILTTLSEKERTAMIERMRKPRESAFFRTGEALPLFNTRDLEGKKLSLKDAKGKVIVLNFWFINCPPCRREIPELNALVDSFRHRNDVIFAAIALDNRNALWSFLETTPFHYQIIDEGKYLADRYRVTSYPTHVIIDQEGKVYFHTSGLASNTVHWIKKSIQELLDKGETK
jgi:thiol-disulfide isomerase/thioredoxin